MDVSRIGTGATYRPLQWAGRTVESASETSARFEPKADARPAGGGPAPGDPLTGEQQKQVDKLKAIDTKVRQHEAAHQAAGGGLVGGASFTYQEGPDGRRYAVGGEVPINAGGGSSPEATIRKMDQVKRAALAPADPSGQDLAVAAAATAAQAQAQQELSKAETSEQAGTGGEGTDEGAPGGLPKPVSGRTDADAENAMVRNMPVQDAASRALAARGIAAYGAAAQINAAPAYASALFA